MAAAEASEQADVLICGAGPVGLLIANCLARYGVSTYVVEQHQRVKQSQYGRAAMIAPRTLEMLDQLDLADALGQIGFVVRGQVSYNNGVKVENLTAPSSGITDTFFDHLLLCRQRHTEDVMKDSYSRYSKTPVQYGAKLADVTVKGGNDIYAVESLVEHKARGHVRVQSKYIIGADGGRSKVRELAGIDFEGGMSNRHWIRIDGIVETNMPEARRGICGIQSPSHGSILWACLDHGATRVGFALPEELWERLGADITKEDVITEAQKALQPFTLKFKSVDWWTVYSVGQRLAGHYRMKDRIFLAGDAAHTHSSGAAQGMNTGLHDAVNLSWKLAGHIQGWLAESVLDSYDAERRPIAKMIIDQDKLVSVLIGGEIPEAFKDKPNIDPHELLTATYKENSTLNTGLGIHYPPDDLTIVLSTSEEDPTITPGERAPDVLLQRPGLRIPVRLQSLIKNKGTFTTITFCGNPSRTHASLKSWRESLDALIESKPNLARIGTHMTITMGSNDAGSPAEFLGVPCFGYALYDVDGSAHKRFGVAPDTGAVFILRPDGTIGTICALGDADAARKYFDRFVIAQLNENSGDHRDHERDLSVGEIDIDRRGRTGDGTTVTYETI